MHFSFPLKTQLRHIGQSFPLIGSLAVAFLTTGALDQFFIRLYLSEQNFVDYFLLFQFYGMFLQFPTLISGLLLNWISATIDEKQTAVITRFFGELIPGVTIAFVVLALVAYGAVSGVLYWFYGLSTDAFALPLLLLMVSSVFSFANIVAYAPYMLAKRQVRMLSFLPFMTAAINLLGNFLLVKPFGITGIATASFFAATLTGLYVHRHIYKELGIKNRTLPLLAVLNSVAVVLVLLSHLTVFGSIFLLLSLNIVFCFLRMQVALQQVKQLRELLVRPTIHLQ
jgi:O-antigen/teichoic acid export membrane protein